MAYMEFEDEKILSQIVGIFVLHTVISVSISDLNKFKRIIKKILVTFLNNFIVSFSGAFFFRGI